MRFQQKKVFFIDKKSKYVNLSFDNMDLQKVFILPWDKNLTFKAKTLFFSCVLIFWCGQMVIL